MTDILKDTLAYHWMTDDAREEGLEQGLARGREEGREEGLCLALMSIIDARFPTVKRLAHNQLASIKHVVPLTKLVTNISLAQSAPEVKQYRLEALEESLELEEGV